MPTTTWTYIKREGAPAGRIRIDFQDTPASPDFIIGDTSGSDGGVAVVTSISTSDPTVAFRLSQVAELALLGVDGDPYVPQPVVNRVFAVDGVLVQVSADGAVHPVDGVDGADLRAVELGPVSGAVQADIDDAALSRVGLTLTGATTLDVTGLRTGAPSSGSIIVTQGAGGPYILTIAKGTATPVVVPVNATGLTRIDWTSGDGSKLEVSSEGVAPDGVGTPGADGRTTWVTSGVPASSLGQNGDVAFRKASGILEFYGPKSAGVWPSGVSLIGPAGTGTDRPDDMRLGRAGAITATVGTIEYPITRDGTVAGVTPSCDSAYLPVGRPVILGLRRKRGGTIVDLFASNAGRPQIAAGAARGAEVAPQQNAGVLAGDALLADVVQGGFTQEAASPQGASIAALTATSGTSFTVDRPVAQNEVQTLTVSGSPTSYVLTQVIGGTARSTAPIAGTASSADMRAALEALPGVGAGNVAVGGGVGGPYTVTWQGALAATPMRLITAGSFVGGTSPGVAAARTTNGQAGLVADADDPSLIFVSLYRNNTTTTVTPPTGWNLVRTFDSNGGYRGYVFSFVDDGAPSWTFAQSGTAGQVVMTAWCEPPAATAPVEDSDVWQGTTDSASFTIPDLSTQGTDRVLLAFVFSGSGPDHRDGPTTQTWYQGSGPVGGRIGLLYRWPGDTQGALGPWTGGKFKDGANADQALRGAVVAVAVTPRSSEPGRDAVMTIRFAAP